MNVIRIDTYLAVQELRAKWKDWDVVARAEAVARLRRSLLSVATLASIAGCSAASIRRLERIDQLPLECKQRIRCGESSAKFLAWARAARRAPGLGASPGDSPSR